MKQMQLDLKHGEAKLKIENLDDLWYLSQIIDIGDRIKGKTLRKIKIGEESRRKQAIIKKPIFLKISVEKIEFNRTSDILRATGIIIECPEDIQKGEHHTFNLEQNTIFTLEKEKWLKFQIEKLKEACSEKISKVLILVMDRDEAHFALLKKYGYDLLTEIRGDVQKKENTEKSKGNFYEEVITQLKEYAARYGISQIIIASPAFWKEDLAKEIKDQELKKKIILATCNATGENGINEVIKRPEVKTALQQDRITQEMKLVEELLAEIKKDNLAAYGIKDTENAANAGAIRSLLITDSLIQKTREENKFGKLDSIMKLVDAAKGEISIISSEHDGGKKLNGLGGIGAILRYKLNY